MTTPHILLNQAIKPVQNIFCIGRNYAKHIAELNNATPSEPLVFLKPTSSLAHCDLPIQLPTFSDDIHYETEIVLYIKENCDHISKEKALSIIGGYGIGLDLTARDIQSQIKAKGEPWTKCKGFRNAAIVSDFVAPSAITNFDNIHFSFKQNGVLKQQGESQLMLYSIADIIVYLVETYGLTEGDLIYTGTPEGVGPLAPGDQLEMTLESVIQTTLTIAK